MTGLHESMDISGNISPALITLNLPSPQNSPRTNILGKINKEKKSGRRYKHSKKEEWMPHLSNYDSVEESISLEEFQGIQFENKWPMLIIDFIQ